ncbi:hypothetical protein ACFY1P_20805 [Streptomyces sp. NPDC001407]|uniref:hypothetical protein n=1 Tax=Streptomyces sp. NPDC001407 TaxID=3364573 RepID=UPI003688A3F2
MSLFAPGTTDYDPAILLPNRHDTVSGLPAAKCPCDGTPGVRDGKLVNHFPPMWQGRPPTLEDPFLPGTALCRYSGRTVTLAAALARDEAQTPKEREIALTVRTSPSVWLGLLDWVAFGDVKVGDRIGFTDTEDDYERRFIRHEREGVVTRKGATFVAVACVPDALGDKARLKKTGWKGFRVRRKH